MIVQREQGESWEQFGRRVAYLNTPIELGSPQPKPLSAEFGEWLKSWQWEAWGTLTFKDPNYTHEAASRAFGRFTRWLQREGNPDVSHFVGHEIGSLGRLHMHCLLGSLAPMTSRSALWRWWFTHYGRAEIKGYDPEQGAAVYVSKYVSKELAHYDLDLTGLDRCQSETLLKSSLTSRTMSRDRRASREKRRSGSQPSARGQSSTENPSLLL